MFFYWGPGVSKPFCLLLLLWSREEDENVIGSFASLHASDDCGWRTYGSLEWPFWALLGDPVDGSEIRLLKTGWGWYIGYPIIYKVLAPSKRWLFGISEPSTVSSSNLSTTVALALEGAGDRLQLLRGICFFTFRASDTKHLHLFATSWKKIALPRPRYHGKIWENMGWIFFECLEKNMGNPFFL